MTTTDQHPALADVSRAQLQLARHNVEYYGTMLQKRSADRTATQRRLYESVVHAVTAEHMSVTEVARLAGLTRQTVYNILKKEEK